jgi:acyl-CoA reductase-like NAD-dependent aldehyde dehydrogenase
MVVRLTLDRRARSPLACTPTQKPPFGGYKRSGSLARDNGTEAIDQYLQTKTVWISRGIAG